MDAILYHTTWVNPQVEASDPEVHMCDAAKFIWSYALQRSKHLQVHTQSIIECASDVSQGIIRAALREAVSFIAMSRDPRVQYGDYLKHIWQRHSVPLLAIGEEVAHA